MTPPVVTMLHEWRLRLSDAVPGTQEELLRLLELPDPSDGNALQALGIARVEIDPSISWFETTFLEPVRFADIVAVFGEWTAVVRAPGNFHESPRGYTTGGFSSPRFTFYVQTKSVRNEAWEWLDTEYCPRLHISLPNFARWEQEAMARVSPMRAWWNRLWHTKKDQA